MLPTMLAIWPAQRLGSEHQQWNSSQAIQLLTDIEQLYPHFVKLPLSEFLQPVNL